MSFSKVQPHRYRHQQLISQENFQLDRAYNVAKSSLIEGSVYRIYLPNDNYTALALRIKMLQESHANSWSWANPYTGKSLHVFDVSQTSTATQVWNFKYKFYIGDFIGWPVKVLWLTISLMPFLFVLSGVYLWIKRNYK